MIALMKVLMPVVVDRSMSWKNGLILEAFIFYFFIFLIEYKCKGSVASLQFGFSNIFKLPPLRVWMLGLLLPVLALINYLLFSLIITGTLRAHSCYVLLLRVIYEYYNSYKERGVINLFQLDESF